MTTTMTARDKTLLYFVALGVFLFVFVRYLFFPALSAHAEAVDALANNETLQADMQDSLLMAPAAAQNKVQAYEDMGTASAVYYSKLKSDALDTLVTGLELNHSLVPVSLTIGEPVVQSLTGYIASASAGSGVGPVADATEPVAEESAASVGADTSLGLTKSMNTLAGLQSSLTGVDWNAAYEQAAYFTTADVRFSATGTRDDFLALLDDLAANYPSVLLQTFSISEQSYANAEGDVSTRATFSAQLTVILCDKEGVPAL